jgi:hypothetical protein
VTVNVIGDATFREELDAELQLMAEQERRSA